MAPRGGLEVEAEKFQISLGVPEAIRESDEDNYLSSNVNTGRGDESARDQAKKEETKAEIKEKQDNSGLESRNYTMDAVTPQNLEEGNQIEDVKTLHEQRKSKYNVRRAKPRTQHPLSMSYSYATNVSGVAEASGMKKGKKLNQLISRLTRQTESSGRKNRNQVGQNELFSKPATTYQNFYKKPYSAVKPARKTM